MHRHALPRRVKFTIQFGLLNVARALNAAFQGIMFGLLLHCLHLHRALYIAQLYKFLKQVYIFCACNQLLVSILVCIFKCQVENVLSTAAVVLYYTRLDFRLTLRTCAAVGLLCSSGSVVQQWVCCAAVGLLCNSGSVVQQWVCCAAVSTEKLNELNSALSFVHNFIKY